MDAGTLIFGAVIALNFTLSFAILARTVARIGGEEGRQVK